MENYMVSEIMDLNYNGLYWIGGIGKTARRILKFRKSCLRLWDGSGVVFIETWSVLQFSARIRSCLLADCSRNVD